MRVLAFGESFTYGGEVGDRECWCARLEALDPRIEAVNFGVGGYGTDQALLRFRREGQVLGAKLVCLGLMLENIGRNVTRYSRLWNPWLRSVAAKPRFELEGGALVLVPQPFRTEDELLDAVADGSIAEALREHEHWAEPPRDAWLWRSSIARLIYGAASARGRTPPFLWQQEQGEPFQVTVALLAAFHDEVKASGARALILVFPRKEDLELVQAGGERYWSGLLRELGTRGIDVLDTSDALAHAAGDRPAAAVYGRAHFTAEGNDAVAAALLEWIRAQGLLDPPGPPR